MKDSSSLMSVTPPAFDRAVRTLLAHEKPLLIGLICALIATAWWAMVDMLGTLGAHGELGSLGPGMTMLEDLSRFFLVGPDSLSVFSEPQSGPGFHLAHNSDLLILSSMWLLMVAGMMLPTAVPTVLVHLNLTANARRQDRTAGSSFYFVAGYLLTWAAAGLFGSVLQWLFRSLAWMSPGMVSANVWLSVGVLMIAGAYQLSSLKDACLTACRSPMVFFMTQWREGRRGALRMGIRHGLVCLGCCWALMGVMYVVGVMNLVWMGLLGALMLSEKVWRRGKVLGRVTGYLLLLWGLALGSTGLLG